MQRLGVVLCAVFLLSSCGKDNGVGTGGIAGYSVPYLASGTETYCTTTLTKDSLNNILESDVDSELVRIEGLGEMVDGYAGLTRVSALSLSHNLGSESVWYKTDADSLVEMAYSGAGRVTLVLPKEKLRFAFSPLDVPPLVWQMIVKKLGSDSIIARTDPRVVYRYPLTQGRSWAAFHDPWLEEREVVGSEIVTVKAGVFYCSKIKTTISFGTEPSGVEWFDYVASQGLILRTISVSPVTVTSVTSPDSAITGSSTQRMELVSVQ